jgi:hypothetical protein
LENFRFREYLLVAHDEAFLRLVRETADFAMQTGVVCVTEIASVLAHLPNAPFRSSRQAGAIS